MARHPIFRSLNGKVSRYLSFMVRTGVGLIFDLVVDSFAGVNVCAIARYSLSVRDKDGNGQQRRSLARPDWSWSSSWLSSSSYTRPSRRDSNTAIVRTRSTVRLRVSSPLSPQPLTSPLPMVITISSYFQYARTYIKYVRKYDWSNLLFLNSSTKKESPPV